MIKILLVLFLQCQQTLQAVPFGSTTTKITKADIDTLYNYWQANYIEGDAGGARVKWQVDGWPNLPQNKIDGALTASEGMGYGMLITAYLDDRSLFDRLLSFYNFVVQQNKGSLNNLSPWLVDFRGIPETAVGGEGPATDGDIDVAMALLIAYHNGWGNAYRSRAVQIIDTLRSRYFSNSCGVWIMRPGDFGGCGQGQCIPDGQDGDVHDVSYYSPGYFRVFADVTGDSEWNDIADATYEHINRAKNFRSRGGVLVPDFQMVDGDFSCKSFRSNNYAYDASRIPWRIAIDHIWFNTANARTVFLDDANYFARTTGAANIVDGYQVKAGNPATGRFHNAAFVGGFACGMMAAVDEDLETFAAEFKSLSVDYVNSGRNLDYFSSSLSILYSLMLTGNFFEPNVQ
eukprot:TRINITY_DN2342_c0_g2_i1.p1 TRINITY_DN2342_c0_g2~~TRINITY_DN2342_c0_g2_i1.p1  ORF type:complete len:420 (-),score=44.37 TRINITY_DN2342_c0_g2_i1:402-1607(-)